MAEILTNLRINTKSFDAKLNRSGKSVNKFKKSTKDSTFGKGFNLLKGSISGVLGPLSAVAAGVGIFKSALDSSQTVGDAFRNTLDTAKTTVDNFMYSITSGDWTAFFDGLDTAIDKARDAAIAIDQLGNTMMAFNIAKARAETLVQEKYTAFQEAAQGTDIAVLEKAREEWLNAIKQYERYGKNYAKEVTRDIQDILGAKIGGDFNVRKVSYEDLVNLIIGIDLSESPRAMREKMTKDYATYVKLATENRNKIKEVVKQYRAQKAVLGAGYAVPAPARAKATKEIERLNKLYKALKSTGVGYQDTYKSAILFNATLVKMSDEELQGILNKLATVEQVEKRISRKKGTYATALATGVKKGAEPTAIIPLTPRVIPASIKDMQDQAGIAGYEAGKIFAEYFAAGQKGTKADIPKIKPSTGYVQGAKDVTTYAQAISGLGSAMQSMSGIVEGSASNWIQWGANVLTSIAQAIPAIMALSAAQNAKAQMDGKAAVAGGMSAVASVPYVGPALALGAAASIIAALAAMPKFAQGGVVPGNSYAGDRTPILANAGELILNQSQQRNIATKLTQGGGNVRVTGDFRISGRDLKLLIDQEERLTKRT